MKSLVEEASSVVKAIEKAWNRAGCPQTFSVKVFEAPETNFFGFTKKSAKVGIFFEEEPAPQQKKYVSQNRDQRSQGTSRPQPKGRTDASSYSREREEKEDEVQVDSRRTNSSGRQPNQGQRTYEPRQTTSSVQKEAVTQRPESAQHEDRQDRQPSRERHQRPTGGRPPRTNDRNDRERDEQTRQTRTDAPVVEQEQRREPRQEPRREYEPRQEQPRQARTDAPVAEQEQRREYELRQDQEPRREQREHAPRQERDQDSREPRGDYEDNRREGGSRDRNLRSGDRRSSSRGGDRDRGGRSPRPERAQRHEFDEQRPMFNNGQSEQSQPTNEQHQAPAHSAPEMASAPASLAPQKKVLKVSGRRYSAPVKKTDE